MGIGHDGYRKTSRDGLPLWCRRVGRLGVAHAGYREQLREGPDGAVWKMKKAGLFGPAFVPKFHCVGGAGAVSSRAQDCMVV